MDKIKRQKRVLVVLIIVITLILLAAMAAGYFLLKSANDKKINEALSAGYGIGYNKSLQDVAQAQTDTGSILVWQEDSIKIVSIQDVCNGLINQAISNAA